MREFSSPLARIRKRSIAYGPSSMAGRRLSVSSRRARVHLAKILGFVGREEEPDRDGKIQGSRSPCRRAGPAAKPRLQRRGSRSQRRSGTRFSATGSSFPIIGRLSGCRLFPCARPRRAHPPRPRPDRVEALQAWRLRLSPSFAARREEGRGSPQGEPVLDFDAQRQERRRGRRLVPRPEQGRDARRGFGGGGGRGDRRHGGRAARPDGRPFRRLARHRVPVEGRRGVERDLAGRHRGQHDGADQRDGAFGGGGEGALRPFRRGASRLEKGAKEGPQKVAGPEFKPYKIGASPATVEMPRPPKVEDVKVNPKPDAPIIHRFVSNYGNRVYIAAYADIPESERAKEEQFPTLLQALNDDVVQSLKGKALAFGGLEARRFVFHSDRCERRHGRGGARRVDDPGRAAVHAFGDRALGLEGPSRAEAVLRLVQSGPLAHKPPPNVAAGLALRRRDAFPFAQRTEGGR